jgi:heme oxygenase
LHRQVTVQRLSRTLIQLNVATRAQHAEADAPWLDLMVPTISKQRYLDHLIRIYGFEAPLEAAFHYTPGLSALVDLRPRVRSGLLVQDLMHLGLSAARIAHLPQRFAAFGSATEALGWMYVIERSALLHGSVRRYLLKRQPDLGDAVTYLSAYEGIAGQRWSDLGDALEAVASDPGGLRQVVRAANQAFNALCDWLRNPSSWRDGGWPERKTSLAPAGASDVVGRTRSGT